MNGRRTQHTPPQNPSNLPNSNDSPVSMSMRSTGSSASSGESQSDNAVKTYRKYCSVVGRHLGCPRCTVIGTQCVKTDT